VGGSSLQQNELPLVGGFLSGFPIPPSSSSQVSSSPPAGSGGFYERILGLLSTSWANIEVNQQMGDDDKATAQLIMTMALDSIREQRLNWIQVSFFYWYLIFSCNSG
jgi:hypothetical protein